MPGIKPPGIFYLKGNIMLQRVISYQDGRVVFYYDDKEVTYRKGKEPEIVSRIYNKKEKYGLLGGTPDIRNYSRSLSWD